MSKHNELNCFSMYIYKPHSVRGVFQNLKQFFRNLKYAYQRATRGYCDADVWGLDRYLSNIMHDTLYHLADITHGYPCGMDDSNGEGGYEKWTKELKDNAEKIHLSTHVDFSEEVCKTNDSAKIRRLMQEETEIKHRNLNEFCDWLKDSFFDLWD